MPQRVGQRITLIQACEIAHLKVHWRRIKKDLRSPRVQGFYLAADPLDWLPFDFRLDDELTALRAAVLDGSYQAQKPEMIRAAKALGLTRPLSFLSARDALLYRNLLALAENDLMQSMPPWTRFGRADSRAGAGANNEPESGWFRAWLQRNGQLWALTEDHDWIVETDVSNFFPSVHLDAALDHLLANTRLDVDCIRLLRHLLEGVAPLSSYRQSPVVGLPQENFDCSRIIAHSFLGPMDLEFSPEGGRNRYSRYMDDVVIGVDSFADGLAAVSRSQRALEGLALYPNASKTRIVKAETFAHDYMKAENDYLGIVSDALNDDRPVDIHEFRERLRRHVGLEPHPRGWERVLRRYYTLSRSSRVDYLLGHAPRHLTAHPGSVRQILDYASTFLLTPQRISRFAVALQEVGQLYEDLYLLTLQYMAIAPNNVSLSLRDVVVDFSKGIIATSLDSQPQLAASGVVVIGKFGLDGQGEYLLDLLDSTPRDGSRLRRQLALVSLGMGIVDFSYVAGMAVESNESRLMVDYLAALHAGENRAVNLALDAAAPRERRQPLMFMSPPRPMFLAPIALRLAKRVGERKRNSWQRSLARAEGPRDRHAETWLRR